MSIASGFQNLKVSTKVIAAFALVTLATASLGSFAIIEAGAINAHTEDLRKNWIPAMNSVAEIKFLMIEYRQKEAAFLLAPTEEARKSKLVLMHTALSKIADQHKIYDPTIVPGPEQEIARTMAGAWSAYVALEPEMIAIYTDKGQAAAGVYYTTTMLSIFNTAGAAADANTQFQNTNAKESAEAGKNTYEAAKFWILIALGLTAAFGGLAGLTLILAVSKPLRAMTGVMHELATGNLGVTIPAADRKDEIGQLAGAMTAFKEQLAGAERSKVEQTKTIIDSIGTGLTALSGGDLTHRVSADLVGPFAKLKEDFNGALGRLQDTMKNVLTSTSGISTGADEIAQAADDLSRRTEQNAASLEETAAALEQITATVKKTAQNAKEANKIVTGAKSAAEDGGRVVETAITAMGQIEQSSKKITDIIGVIDEIAFQTNLLALNAGVEAARAGDAGKGFAVVASEVRALAQRSSEAAREIKTLIKTSGEQVDSGVKLVDESGKALKRIVEQVVQIDVLVTEMAQAAQQQSTGIEEVNVAVSQMDQVTQQNAAMVEQSTAASRNLATETAELSEIVSLFNVGAEAASSHRKAPAPVSTAGRVASRSVPRMQLKTVGNGGRRAATAVAAQSAARPEAEDWQEF